MDLSSKPLHLGLHVVEDKHRLIDILVCSVFHSDRDFDRIRILNCLAERQYLFGEGGREKKGLSIRSDLTEYGSHLGFKSHGQHSIGFIEHNKSAPRSQSESLLPQKFNKFSWRGNHNLISARLDVFPQLVWVDSAEDWQQVHLKGFGELVEHGVYLVAQFSSRAENESDRAIAFAQLGLFEHVSQKRNQIRDCFA